MDGEKREMDGWVEEMDEGRWEMERELEGGRREEWRYGEKDGGKSHLLLTLLSLASRRWRHSLLNSSPHT